MDDEQLELINLLSQYITDEIQQILTIMIHWDKMVKCGIVDDEDINNLASLSKEKQNRIKEFVSNKLQDVIERKSDGRRKQEEEEL